MKVGIISINMYSKGLNFACPVHSCAFQQFLLENGVDCTIIDYKPVYYDDFDLKYPARYYQKLYESLLGKKADTPEEQKELKEKQQKYKERRDSWAALQKERAIRYDKLQEFIEKHYSKTAVCYDSDLLEIMDPGFDCYICATDVIWKNEPGQGFDRGFFLGSSSMEQKWKLAYSASQGSYRAENEKEEALFFHYLEDMDAISVREESLKTYIENRSDLRAARVLDPVLLEDAAFYEKILQKPEETNYLLLYYVVENAEETVRFAIRYAEKHKLKIIEITDNPIKGGMVRRFSDCDTSFRYDIGIEEWLGYIRYADCIFTNSFHGSCFAILFEKEFYVGHRVSGKVNELLDLFGLKDRLLPSLKGNSLSAKLRRRMQKVAGERLTPASIEKEPIDYKRVRQVLEQKRAESADFILSAIRSCEKSVRTPRDYTAYKKSLRYRVFYNSGRKNLPIVCSFDEAEGDIEKLPSGSVEYRTAQYCLNDGSARLKKNGFAIEGLAFRGWNLRLRIDHRWFWIMEDGSLVQKAGYQEKRDGRVRLFKEEEAIPFIPVNRISAMVADAIWKQETGEYQ